MKVRTEIQHFACFDHARDLTRGFDFPCTEEGEILEDRLSELDRRALEICTRSPHYEGPFVVAVSVPIVEAQCV